MLEPRLYLKSIITPVVAVVALAGCAAHGDARGPGSPPKHDVRGGSPRHDGWGAGGSPALRDLGGGFEDPESAIAAFSAAWNARAPAAVVDTFTPERRPAVARFLERSTDRSVDRLMVSEPVISTQCHPRGAYWKTGTVRFSSRDPNAEPRDEQEIVWLRLQEGSWFMYSL